MQQFWTAFLTTLTFLALATSDQLILEITDKDWSWIPIPLSGVSRVSMNANLYHMYNGWASDYFTPEKVVRARFPFSPYIFIICVDILANKIREN